MTTMSELLMPLHFLSLLLLCFVSPSTSSFIAIKNPVVGLVACRPLQVQALMQFENEFDTSGCNNNYYSNGVLQKNGVWCDKFTGALTKLRVRACLRGTLKPNSSLFGFHQLRYLDLSHNNFTSAPLPSEFGNLNKLEVLLLSYNGFLSQVPSSFSNLSMLSVLDISYNKLTSPFSFLRNLRKLKSLDLAHNYLSETLHPNSSLFGLNQLSYLNLAHNNFSSSVPSEFGNLNKLEILSLTSNGLFGQVPPTFSNLTLLSLLYLGRNEFTGSFPPVHNLTNLSQLDLTNNNFYGVIPSPLLTMPFLSYLALRGNNFVGSIEVLNSSTSSRLETLLLGLNHFERKILDPISKLINLTNLDLSFLNTSYPIDLSLLCSLKSLLVLDLSGNSIFPTSLSSDSCFPLALRMLYLKQCNISEFPIMLKSLEKLEYINLSNNRIKGKIPEWLWSLPHLSTLNVGNNSFSGFEGPADILVNSSVRILTLEANNFEGALPNLPLPVKFFSAATNHFRGEIPLSICNRSSLIILVLSYNNFTGPVPPCLSNFTIVNLRKNNLEGTIPDVFVSGASLHTLDVGYNQLSGKLPRSLLNCSYLLFLSVDNNRIKDTFPFWLKALPNVQVLTLSSNKFYGPISPPDQGPLAFPELRIFEIANNNFTGGLPSRYFVNWKAPSLMKNEDGSLYMLYEDIEENPYNVVAYFYTDTLDLQYKGLHMEQEKVFTSYSAIDFSGNKLEGQLPESIGFLKALIALNLSNNAFTGHIPLSLTNLKELESLDLSRNQLSGTLPNGLGSLTFLAFINVSHNQLKGEIPQGTQITGQPKSSFEGNAGLCGLPLRESCFGSSPPPIQHHKQEDEQEEEEEEIQVLNWKGVVIGYGLGVLFGLAIAQVITSFKPEWLAKIICLNKGRNR